MKSMTYAGMQHMLRNCYIHCGDKELVPYGGDGRQKLGKSFLQQEDGINVPQKAAMFGSGLCY